MTFPATFKRIRQTLSAGIISSRRADVATRELRRLQVAFQGGAMGVGDVREELARLTYRHNIV